MSHMVLLILLLIGTGNSTPTGRNKYCWRQRSTSSRPPYTSLIYCKNIDVETGDVLRLTNQTSANDDIRRVSFISITGRIDDTVLDLFPKVKHILVARSKITGIAFKPNVTNLNILNSCFPKVTRETLKGIKEIISLNFLANPGLEFELGAFRDLRKLKHLGIINQNIPRLQKGFLEGPEFLQEVMLISNNITKMDEDAFADQPYVLAIYLENNPLESFKLSVSKLPNLFYLSLINTNLKEFKFEPSNSLLQTLNLPTSVLLHNFNSTMVKENFHELDSISIPQDDLENPELKPIEEMLKRDGLELLGFHPRSLDNEGFWRERDFYRLTKC